MDNAASSLTATFGDALKNFTPFTKLPYSHKHKFARNIVDRCCETVWEPLSWTSRQHVCLERGSTCLSQDQSKAFWKENKHKHTNGDIKKDGRCLKLQN